MHSDFKGVLRLAIPAAFKQLLDTLQILVDMLMVGMLSIHALAAVGMSLQFMSIINVVMTLYVVGGNAVIARLIGEKRRHRAAALMYTLLLFALLLSLPVSFAGYFFAGDFYLWMGASSEVAEQGGIYFSIIMLGVAVIFLDTLCFNALSAAGDTTSSLYIKVFSAVVNLFLNYCLIFGNFGFDAMGIAGAAYATMIAYTLNLTIYLFLLRRKGGRLGLLPRWCRTDLRRVLNVGGNAALERAISVMSFIIFVAVITSYGTTTLAGYQVGLRIEGIAFMPGFGFAIAAMALVGQNLGAKNPELAYRSGILSAKIASSFMGLIGLVMIIIPEPFVKLFTEDAETIEHASLYLRLVGISQVPLAMTFVLSGALRGAGATKTTMKINVASMWLLRAIPSYIAMKLGFGILAVYIIMTVETFIKGGIFWHVFKKREWQKVKV